MELRQLRYVVAVAEAKGFTRAAEQVHISQPSLSQQVRLLEDELGVALFSRGPAGTVLTAAGEVVVRIAREIEHKLHELQQELTDLDELRQGSLTLGTLPITGGHVLPPVLVAYKQQYPSIKLHLVEERTPNLIAATLAGQTDLSLLTLPLEHQELVWEPLLAEELLLAVPTHHRLAETGRVSLLEVASDPFVLLKKGNGFRTVCDATCQAAGFVPHCAFESDNIETAKTLVAAGLGVTLVPELIAGITPEYSHKENTSVIGLSTGVVYVRLQPPPTRTVVVAWRRDRYLSKPAQAFHSMLRSYWSEAGQQQRKGKTKSTLL